MKKGTQWKAQVIGKWERKEKHQHSKNRQFQMKFHTKSCHLLDRLVSGLGEQAENGPSSPGGAT